MQEIYGDSVLLRPYELGDVYRIMQWRNDPETTRYMGRKFRNSLSHEIVEEELQQLIISESKDTLFYVIANPKTREYIGGIDLTLIDWIDRVATLSIVIGSSQNRGRGVASIAIRLLCDYAFNELDLRKIELGVYEENISALKCYEKNGFIVEGRLREHMLIEENYVDLIQMGLLKSEHRDQVSVR